MPDKLSAESVSIPKAATRLGAATWWFSLRSSRPRHLNWIAASCFAIGTPSSSWRTFTYNQKQKHRRRCRCRRLIHIVPLCIAVVILNRNSKIATPSDFPCSAHFRTRSHLRAIDLTAAHNSNAYHLPPTSPDYFSVTHLPRAALGCCFPPPRSRRFPRPRSPWPGHNSRSSSRSWSA